MEDPSSGQLLPSTHPTNPSPSPLPQQQHTSRTITTTTNTMATFGKSVHDADGITLCRTDDGLFTLTMNRGENRWNLGLLNQLNTAIGIVEKAEHPKALVVQGSGKFFSNGLDLEWMLAQDRKAAKQNEQQRSNPGASSPATPPLTSTKFIEKLWKLLAKLLVLNCRTVAAINGHAFGAGLFLALCCDYRVMRTRRGYCNFPESSLGMPLSPGFAAIVKDKLPDRRLQREAVLNGRRYGSTEAKSVGMIDEEVPVEQLWETAAEIARDGYAHKLKLINFNPKQFSKLKMELYAEAYFALNKAKAPPLLKSKL